MGEEIKWFEEMTEYLFKSYRSLFLKQLDNYEPESIKKISLLRNQYLDWDEDDNDEVVVDYSLGIYSQDQMRALKNKIDETSVTTVLEDVEDLWGPPGINDAWEDSYNYSEDFEMFQHCVVLANVAQRLLEDPEIKPFLMKKASVFLKSFGDFDEECSVPMYHGKIPEIEIRKKVVEDFVTTKENKALLLSLWNKKITEPGKSFLKKIGINVLPNYPSESDISKELFKARHILVQKEEDGKSQDVCHKAAIASLEPYLEEIEPFTGKKTKKIEEAIKEHERACNYLGLWYKNLNNYDKAEKWWRICYQILPTESGTLNLCLLYKNNKPNSPEFVKICEHITSIYDKLSSYSQMYAWEYLATAYVLNEDIEKASLTFKKLIKDNPDEDIKYYKSLASNALDILFERKEEKDEPLKNKLLSVFE
ncbi:tetratricopeptide repeat protein [Aquimarina sp. SS2-1]|uniref:tetratricopeptide repeat protein n=1 Tax=Aquimarina besae TaxID=3342247 RepID=UPI0036717A94